MGKTEFTDEQRKAIIYNYITLGKGLKETTSIALGTTNYKKVQQFLEENNIPLHKRGAQPISRVCDNLTREQVDAIIYNYVTLNKGLKATGEAVGLDYKTVRKILVRENIPIKAPGNQSRQVFFVNEQFFLEQSHDLGYVLGMLGSDGCVGRERNLIYIELQRGDREILEKINQAIKNDRPVKDYETGRGYENSKIYFYSKVVKDELATYHIIPNKTYDETYGFPDKLREEFIPDYIRGMFDGDGSIKVNASTGHPVWQIDSSSLDVIQKIESYLSRQGILTSVSSQHKVHVELYRITCSNLEGCRRLYDLLYYPAVNLYMKRKYERFTSLLS